MKSQYIYYLHIFVYLVDGKVMYVCFVSHVQLLIFSRLHIEVRLIFIAK